MRRCCQSRPLSRYGFSVNVPVTAVERRMGWRPSTPADIAETTDRPVIEDDPYVSDATGSKVNAIVPDDGSAPVDNVVVPFDPAVYAILPKDVPIGRASDLLLPVPYPTSAPRSIPTYIAPEFQEAQEYFASTSQSVVLSDLRAILKQDDLRDETELEALASSGNGAGIQSLGVVHLFRVVFRNCVASRAGGAIWTSGTLNALDCVFDGNRARTGSGIYVAATGVAQLERNRFVASEIATELDAPVLGCGNTGLMSPELVARCSDSAASVTWSWRVSLSLPMLLLLRQVL